MKIQGCIGCSNLDIKRFDLCESCQPINNIISPKSTIYFNLDDTKDIKKLYNKKGLDISDPKYGNDAICEIKVGSIGRAIIYDLDGNKYKIRYGGYSNIANKLYNKIEDLIDCSVVNKSGGCYVRIFGNSQISLDRIIKNTDEYTRTSNLYDCKKDISTRYITDELSNIFYAKQLNSDCDIMSIVGFKSKQDVKELVEKTYEDFLYYSI